MESLSFGGQREMQLQKNGQRDAMLLALKTEEGGNGPRNAGGF